MIRTSLKNKTFLNPEVLLKDIGLEPAMIVADFGCGNGFYAAAAGELVGDRGRVFALDILEEALSQTASLAKSERLHNVTTRLCDLEKLGSSQIPDTSCDLVILASLLHQVDKKDSVMREAYRVLRTDGRVLVVEWYPSSLFGPPPDLRIPKEQAAALLEKNGFRPVSEVEDGSFHYALLYSK